MIINIIKLNYHSNMTSFEDLHHLHQLTRIINYIDYVLSCEINNNTANFSFLISFFDRLVTEKMDDVPDTILNNTDWEKLKREKLEEFRLICSQLHNQFLHEFLYMSNEKKEEISKKIMNCVNSLTDIWFNTDLHNQHHLAFDINIIIVKTVNEFDIININEEIVRINNTEFKNIFKTWCLMNMFFL